MTPETAAALLAEAARIVRALPPGLARLSVTLADDGRVSIHTQGRDPYGILRSLGAMSATRLPSGALCWEALPGVTVYATAVPAARDWDAEVKL